MPTLTMKQDAWSHLLLQHKVVLFIQTPQKAASHSSQCIHLFALTLLDDASKNIGQLHYNLVAGIHVSFQIFMENLDCQKDKAVIK